MTTEVQKYQQKLYDISCEADYLLANVNLTEAQKRKKILSILEVSDIHDEFIKI